MNLVIKALMGAVVALLISLASGSRWYVLAGLVPLFPTFALLAHYIVGTERGPAPLRETALFGLFALIPYFAYLLTVYLLAEKGTLGRTLTLASLAWLVAAGILLLLWGKFRA